MLTLPKDLGHSAQMLAWHLGLVHTLHFCHVALVLHLIQNLYSRVCGSVENVLNVVYSIWWMKILSNEGFFEKLSANGTRWRKLTMHQYVFQYFQFALGQEWPRFFFFFGGTTFMHAHYINMMYVWDLTWQKFDIWISVTFLSNNATRPVKCAADWWQLIQTSNFCQI